MSKNLVVLISGRGSNMQTIHKRTLDGTISGEIKAVVSNNPEAGGLGYAAENALATHVINHKEFASREKRSGRLRLYPGLVVFRLEDQADLPSARFLLVTLRA